MKAISQFPKHRNTKEVRSFVGLAGFYRLFLKLSAAQLLPRPIFSREKHLWSGKYAAKCKWHPEASHHYCTNVDISRHSTFLEFSYWCKLNGDWCSTRAMSRWIIAYHSLWENSEKQSTITKQKALATEQVWSIWKTFYTTVPYVYTLTTSQV